MKLLLDTSVWVAHLRQGALDSLIAPIRSHFVLRMDAIVAAELVAGCRSKRERRVVATLCRPYERAGRLLSPERGDIHRAAQALSRLRSRGRSLSGSDAGLLDALIAAVAARAGALLVTSNISDFSALAREIPVRVEAFERFRERFLH